MSASARQDCEASPILVTRARVEALAVPVAGADLRVSLSAGIAEHRTGETMAQTLDRAARELYDAKSQGRNRVVVG